MKQKKTPTMRANWSYDEVETKVWAIPNLTDFWGVGSRTEKRLNKLGIHSIKDLANSNPDILKLELFRRKYDSGAVRQIGVFYSGFVDEGFGLLSLFDDIETIEKEEKLQAAIDAVREQFDSKRNRPIQSVREYQDTGMQKWMGFFLSEHDSALVDDSNKVTYLSSLSLENKVLLISQLYANQLTARIAATENNALKYYTGTLPTISSRNLLIKTSGGHFNIDLNYIISIELVEEVLYESA